MKAIAKAASVSPATVYAWSSQHKWKRPAGRGVKGSSRPPVAAPAAAADPKVEQLAGRVRCESCQQMTETDPCSACGRKLPRKW